MVRTPEQSGLASITRPPLISRKTISPAGEGARGQQQQYWEPRQIHANHNNGPPHRRSVNPACL